MHNNSRKAVIAALFGNFGIAAFKFLFALFKHLFQDVNKI